MHFYIWTGKPRAVLAKERYLCGYCSSVHFLTLLLGKGGLCLSLYPSSKRTRCSSSQRELKVWCVLVLIFRVAKTS